MKRAGTLRPFNPLISPTVLPNGLVFIPTGKPQVVNISNGEVAVNPRRQIDFPDYAQMFVGLESQQLGQIFTLRQIRTFFLEVRRGQIGEDNVGATFIAQEGLYRGTPERSVQIIVYFFPIEEENKFKKFQNNMLRLASSMLSHFGQEAIYVNFYKKGRPYGAYEIYLR